MENVNDFFSSYKKAAWDKDIVKMINLYDDKVLIFDMWGKGFVSGIEDWSTIIKDWLSSLGEERVNVKFEMIDVQESESIAFATALIQFQAISPEQKVLRSMKNRISLGFIESNGQWKVKHQHTSAPIDNELKAILDL